MGTKRHENHSRVLGSNRDGLSSNATHASLVVSNRLGEGFGAFVDDDVPPTVRQGLLVSIGLVGSSLE